jgi:hypothetical protein
VKDAFWIFLGLVFFEFFFALSLPDFIAAPQGKGLWSSCVITALLVFSAQ